MSNNILNEKEKDVKEGFSDWRQDLSEVIGDVKKNTNKSEDIKVTEKAIKNKITINPTLGEAVEELGGTLLEMVEIEDFECAFDELSESDIFFLTDDLIEEVVEEVFIESLQEGYNVFEIENVLLESLEVSSALLNEAKVTYGHDTDVKSDRLEKVKSAVKKVGKGILRGAGYVAGAAVRGAKAAGRELSAGYKSGRRGSGGSSDSDSSSSPTSTQSDSDSDSTDSGSSKPGLLSRIGSALKRGLKKVVAKGARAVSRGARNVARKMSDGQSTVSSPSPSSKVTRGKGSTSTTQPTPSSSKKSSDPWGEPTTPSKAASKPQTSSKPQAKTTTIPAKPSTEEQRQAVIRATRRNPNLSKSDAERISAATPSKEERRRESRARMSAAAAKLGLDEAHYSLATGKVEPGKPGEAHTNAISDLAAKAKTKKKTRKPVGTSRRGGSFKPSSPEEAEANKKSWGDYWSSAAKGYREQYEIFEKAESKQQQKLFGLALSVKRGETSRSEVSAEVLKIVDSMSEKKIRDFAKTSHEGLPKKVQTKEEAIREALLDRMFEKIEEQSLNYYEPEGEMVDEAKKKSLNLIDLDANAMKPKKPGVEAEIEVKKDKETVRTLNPQQFNTDKKRDDEKYDFNQFRSSKVFKKTLGGNKKVRNLHRGGESVGLTARGGMDNNREVVKHVKDSGFSKKHGVNFKGISFTGDVPGKNTDDKKMKVIKNIIKTKKPKSIKFSDDHAKNLDAPEKFNREEGKDKTKNRGSSVPKIKTYLTRDDGRPVRYGSGGGGVRDSGNVNPPSSSKENQRRRKTARRGMGESYDDSGFRQHSSSITSSSNSSNTPSKTASLMSRMRELGLMSPPKKKKKKKRI